MLLMLVGCGLVDTQTEFSPLEEEGPISRVEVDLLAGDVLLTGDTEASGAKGTFTATFSDTPPDVESYVEDGVLHVSGECTALQAVCELDLAVTVPAGADVVIETGSGALTIEGVTGSVTAKTGSGDLCARHLDGYVDVETGSGDVTADGIAGELVAETGSGDVVAVDVLADVARVATGSGDVDVTQAGPFSRLDAETASGDIALVVPAGPYALTADSGSGDVDVDPAVVADGAAAAEIVARTGSGDVRIASP